ncbi:MAG: ABC transporter permease subunit [Aggregatilineales bacterium]
MDSTRINISPAMATPTVHRSRTAEKILGKDWKVALPFVLPMFIIMAGLVLYPFINALILSTTTLNFISGETVNVGFRNYERLLTNSDYRLAMQNTAQFTIWSISVKFFIGMIVALVLNSRLPFRSLITAIMLLPWIVPEIVTALAWKSVYDPIFGGLNPILQSIGVIDQPMGWLSDPHLAMPSIIVVNVWKGIPFYTLLFLAGLKAIDREQLEAAEVDGANMIKRFRHITLPGMRYVIVVTLLLSFISTFNQFGLIFLMTGGGPAGATKVYSILAYEKGIRSLQFGPGVAIAFSVAPLMIVIIWLLARFMRSDDQRVTVTEKITIADRVMRVVGYFFSLLLDLFFLPFEWITRGFEMLADSMKGVLKNPEGQPMFTRKGRKRMGLLGRILILMPIFIFVVFPLYWVVIVSFKTTPQISERTSIFWPEPWTFDQYSNLLTDTPFLTWFINTAIVAVSSTLISVVLASLAAYALTRLRFRGSGTLTTILLVTYLLPGTMLFIPLYQTLTDLGVINSYGALILTYPTFLMPFATWVMMGYFRSIPVELEEAAMIDGASRLGAFWRITLPLAAPALGAVALFAFTTAWNEFLFAFVFIFSESLRTLPVGLQSMIVGDILPWGQLMAASILMAVPVVIIYTFAQRFLAEGLTVGGVKG